MTYLEIVRSQLRIDEDWRKHPYKDSVGKWSIGCGRNLDDVGLRDNEIAFMLDNDIEIAEVDARALFRNFDSLSDQRKAVLLNMAFNLGRDRLAGFVRFRTAVEANNFELAYVEMLDSTWARQVGARSERLAIHMREG